MARSSHSRPALRQMPQSRPSARPIVLFARVAFWAAAVFAVTMALLPQPPRLPVDELGDKFAHILAFTVLAVLANLAFPATDRLRLIERLSFLGAAIEVVQSVPELHRDCNLGDWVADSLAVLVVTTGFALWSRWRRQTANFVNGQIS